MSRWPAPVLVIAVVAALLGWLVSTDRQADVDAENTERNQSDTTEDRGADRTAAHPLDAVEVAQSVPAELLAAERFVAEPDASSLRALLDVMGGLDALEIGRAEGAFDLVRFDPTDSDQLLAAHRSSYGPAQNQHRNELWRVGDDEVIQALWDPATEHDFAHYNVDGTITSWAHGGGSGFAPRVATVLAADREPIGTTSAVHASRFTATGGTVFSLTGSGDYYATDRSYVDLLADDGSAPPTRLGNASDLGWIDNPTTGLLVAYPEANDGLTMVWDAATLAPLPTHTLAQRPFQRVAVSRDRTTAVGISTSGELESIDFRTGASLQTFGNVDSAGVDQPITLSPDGRIAVTVERTGKVSIWWVADGSLITSVRAGSGQPRWLSDRYASTSASAVAADADRVALHVRARGDVPTHWIIVDTDPRSWIERACERAGRVLTDDEARALGFEGQRACRAE